jgi:hypothetical protein
MFSMGENYGVFEGVSSISALSSYIIFMIKLDLWDQRLSNTKTNYL